MLNALGVPTVAVLYYRVRATAKPGQTSHLFVAVDERERVVRVPSSRLSLITSTIDAEKLKLYNGSVTADPLGSLLLKVNGSTGERINRFPPIFGFKMPKGDKSIYDRRPELEALRRDGYLAMTFLPVPGVDHRMQLMSEIASLWGYSLVATEQRWPDLLVLRHDTAERDDLGGVPDETWLHHALSRVLEDHLPIVEVDGLWMGSLPRPSLESRSQVFYAVLDWVRMRRLPYITARTFHCYVRRDLSCVVALGSLRDRMELIAWLEAYPFESLTVNRAKGEINAAAAVFGTTHDETDGDEQKRSIALRDGSTDNWLVVSNAWTPGKGKLGRSLFSAKNLEDELRAYYGTVETCSAAGSPLTGKDVIYMSVSDLLKIVRVAECEAAASGVCLFGPGSTATASRAALPDAWTVSHRAYRAAVRSHILRTHDSLGVYRLGPYVSQFFSFEVHQYISMPPESRYRPVVSQIDLAPDEGGMEDALLKALVGTVWLLSVQEPATATSAASDIEILQVATDREGEDVRKVLFKSWRTGHIIGAWCRVMLTHREALSISVAGGTVDPLLSHAGDSVVDGNRWLKVTERAMTECSAS